MRHIFALASGLALALAASAADAQSTPCDIPRETRDIWRCENGFVIGPENVIIRLPIPETDPEALYRAGLEAAKREDWRIAIAYFTAAHQRAHLVPRYMYNLGLAHARAGHEVAAIGWFAAYLVAEPDSPNRAAVWTQIAELEASVRGKIDRLWRAAEAAAAALPMTARQSDGTTPFGRAEATEFVVAGRAAVKLRPGLIGELSAIEWTPLVSVSKNVSEYVNVGRSSGSAGMRDAAGLPSPPGFGLTAAVLRNAALGNVQAVRDALANWNPAIQGRPGERFFADLAEIFLLNANSEAAAWAADRAREEAAAEGGSGWRSVRVSALIMAERGQIADAVTALQVHSSRYGGQQRLALSSVREVIAQAQDRWSRSQLAPITAHQSWDNDRFNAVTVVAQYLFWRGRRAEALLLARQLDSRRASDLRSEFHPGTGQSYDPDKLLSGFESQALAAASLGLIIPERRLRATQIQVVSAIALSGAAYDLDRGLVRLANERILYADRTILDGVTVSRGAEQVMLLASTAQALTFDLRQICWDYEWNAGGPLLNYFRTTWGGDNSQPYRCYQSR